MMDAVLLGRFSSRYVIDENGCWVWTAGATKAGYSQITYQRTKFYGHRLSYEHFVGPIPDGLVIDHLCRNTRCVNPTHLEPVTDRENILRGDTIPARYAARTHCEYGHPLPSERTAWGERRCPICHARRAREYHARKRARLAAESAA